MKIECPKCGHGGEVDDPSHYTNSKIQPIEFILANDIPFCEANVIKYMVRWKEKGGVEDLRKAKRYIDFLIEHHETNTETES